jgi:uncharacterized protein YecE (DUF72 family)
MRVYTGTSGFAHQEWKGNFYPEKIAAKDLLRHYGTKLNAVEINNTFYHMPNGTVLASWYGQVPEDFVFALKAPQAITHMKRLHNVSSETGYLFKTLSVLQKKLGPVLFQFPKSFRADAGLLKEFLGLVPRGVLCAFDFRSPTWLESGVPELLRGRGLSWCMEDTDENPVEEIVDTASWGYLRLRRSEYTDTDLGQWAEKLLAQKWESAYVFFKHEGEIGGGELAVRFQEIVEAQQGQMKTGTIEKKAG